MSAALEAFWGDGGLADQMSALIKSTEAESGSRLVALRRANSDLRARIAAAEAVLTRATVFEIDFAVRDEARDALRGGPE